MDFSALFDPVSASLVVGGTCVATIMRAGWADAGVTLRQIGELARPAFIADSQRTELASYVQRMQRDGVIRSDPGAFSDPEISHLTDTLCRNRNVEAMLAEHRRLQSLRFGTRMRAVTTLEIAGELAPLLGLAGTLLALSQAGSAMTNSPGDVLTSVSMAVVSTLYGLCFAHLVLSPLAGAITRRGQREDGERRDVVQWLSDQLADACPPMSEITEHDDRKVA